MAMTQYTGDTDIIAALGTTPQERGLETQQFKAKFDEGLKGFVEWFNLTHKTEFELVQTDIATHLADMASYDQFEIPSNQSIADTTFTNVNFSNHTLTKFCTWDDVNKRINFSKVGIYEVITAIIYSGSATGRRELVIKQNGTAIKNAMIPGTQSDAANYAVLFIPSLVEISELTDYLEFSTQQTSGGALDILQTVSTSVQIKYIGGL